jgi:hypothetical protein
MGGGNTGVASADFNPAEEFGGEQLAGGAAASDGGADMSADINSADASADAGMGGGLGGGMGLPGAPAKRRYVDDDEAVPYKTRGFYLSVVMDHKRLPELLVELTHSPWPVQITRVQYVRLHNDDTTGQGLGGGMLAGGYGMGANPYGGGFGGSGSGYASEPAYTETAADTAGYGSSFGGSGGGYGEGGAGVTVSANDPVLLNPDLAHVAISGLMTLYRPPGEAAASSEAGTPETADPNAAMEQAVPTDPALEAPANPDAATTSDAAPETVPGTVPAEPAPAETAPANGVPGAAPAAPMQPAIPAEPAAPAATTPETAAPQ